MAQLVHGGDHAVGRHWSLDDRQRTKPSFDHDRLAPAKRAPISGGLASPRKQRYRRPMARRCSAASFPPAKLSMPIEHFCCPSRCSPHDQRAIIGCHAFDCELVRLANHDRAVAHYRRLELLKYTRPRQSCANVRCAAHGRWSDRLPSTASSASATAPMGPARSPRPAVRTMAVNVAWSRSGR